MRERSAGSGKTPRELAPGRQGGARLGLPRGRLSLPPPGRNGRNLRERLRTLGAPREFVISCVDDEVGRDRPGSVDFEGWLLGSGEARSETFLEELSLDEVVPVRPLHTVVRVYLTTTGEVVTAVTAVSNWTGQISGTSQVPLSPVLFLTRHSTVERAAEHLLALRRRYGGTIASDAIVEAVGRAACTLEEALTPEPSRGPPARAVSDAPGTAALPAASVAGEA